MTIPNKDKDIIQDLAKKVAEIANLPIQKEKAEMWTRHNSLERVKPMVLIWPDWKTCGVMLDDELETTDSFCRGQERALRLTLYKWEHMRDDSVIEPFVYSPVAIQNAGWSLGTKTTNPEHYFGAKRFEPVIVSEADIDKIQMPQIDQIKVDLEKTEQNYQRFLELYDGILEVKKRGISGLGFAIIDRFIRWRGLQQTFLDMVDRPEWLHSVLDRMTEAHLRRLDALEKQNALSLNNGSNGVGSGGLGFTDELPQSDFDGTHVRAIDMWGHATTQFFSEVSPAMHQEFALDYEKKFLARFGLNCYGCCEPLHKKTDIITNTLPNLRRVSMSPWVDVEQGAAGLGDKYIFSYKPNPAILAAETWEPEAAQAGLRDALEKTKDCVVEIVMKDLHSCRNEPHRMWEWTKIAMETAEEFAY